MTTLAATTIPEMVNTLPQWRHVFDALLASVDDDGRKVVSFDVETDDYGYPDIEMVGCSFAWFDEQREIQACYVPIGHRVGLNLAWNDIVGDLRQLFSDTEREIVAHNAKYEVLATRVQQPALTFTGPLFDTMVASFMLQTNGVGTDLQILEGHGSHGLKDLSKYLLSEPMQELKTLAKKTKVQRNGRTVEVLLVSAVPIKEIAPYGAADARQTLKLRQHFLPQLQADQKTWKYFNNIAREIIHCLAEMHDWGIEIDTRTLDTMRVEVERVMFDAVRGVFASRPEEDFPELDDTQQQLLGNLCAEWDALEHRFTLPKDDARYPRNAKGGPAGKGSVRKTLIAASGLDSQPLLIAKVTDDKLRPFLKAWPELAHKAFNLNSNNDLSRILFDEAYLQPKGELGKNGLHSTKAEYVEEWAQEGSEIATALLRYRELAKLHGTYLVGMAQQVSDDGRLRTSLHQIGARTGRLSSSDPNLQNIPTNKEFPVRKAFVGTGCSGALRTEVLRQGVKGAFTGLLVEGPDGFFEVGEGDVVTWGGEAPPWPLFVGDYSQLEIRLLAHASADEVLLEAVLQNQDIHALTAQAVFDHIPKDISLDAVKEQFAEERSKAKPINFGVIYGMGPQKLARELGITEEEAQEMIDVRYMKKYRGVERWIAKQHQMVEELGYAVTAMGRKRHLPAIQMHKAGNRHAKRYIGKAKRQGQNHPIQGLAADVVLLAMRNIRRAFRSYTVFGLCRDAGVPTPVDLNPNDCAWGAAVRMLLQVHDELVIEFHPAIANYAKQRVVELMEGPVKLKVPLVVSAALGVDWASTKQ